MKEDSTGSLSDIAAEKIAHDYVPPIAKVKALGGDQIIDAVIDEELANNGQYSTACDRSSRNRLRKKAGERTQCH